LTRAAATTRWYLTMHSYKLRWALLQAEQQEGSKKAGMDKAGTCHAGVLSCLVVLTSCTRGS
jgi:hypothetical protein